MADRIVPASRTTGPLERSPQTLPVPLGGLAPVHRRASAVRRNLRRHSSIPILVVSLAAAIGGVGLFASPPSFDAGEDAAGVHIDGMILTPVASAGAGIRTFSGAATEVIHTTPSGAVRAGAVMTWNGMATKGRCLLLPTAMGAEEVCDYVIGTSMLTSIDTFSAVTRTWRRRYGDGVDIVITVPKGCSVIPIPFPLDR